MSRAKKLAGKPLDRQFSQIIETAARGNFVEARHLLKIFASTNIPPAGKSERQMIVDLLSFHITHERRLRKLERDMVQMQSAFINVWNTKKDNET